MNREAVTNFTVAAGAEEVVELVWRPVVEGTSEAMATLRSAELGSYPYKMELTAKPPGLEPALDFMCALGKAEARPFRFKHYAAKPAVFAARILEVPGKPQGFEDFSVDAKEIKANGAAADGEAVEVEVRFQPTAMVERRGLLVLESPDGGKYQVQLVGHVTAPQPQGPVTVVSGKGGSVEFRNPFDVKADFALSVDNAEFGVAPTVAVEPKKDQAIPVTFKGAKESGCRLVITHGPPHAKVTWTYFLKGTLS